MSNIFATTDRPSVGESNGLVNGLAYHASFEGAEDVYWTAPGLRITRLRLVSDRGYPAWDVSYCHGELNGKKVRVGLPFNQLPKRSMKAEILRWARIENVYAKGTGIFDNISTLC